MVCIWEMQAYGYTLYACGKGVPCELAERARMGALVNREGEFDMETISRRGLLKGGAALAAGTIVAGGADLALADEAKPAYEYAKLLSEAPANQVETEVLVIGGGGAGICAALAASEQGAKVVLCEKSGVLGGATIMSSGKIPAVGTAQQEAILAENDEVDSIGACVMDIMRPSNYSVRPDLVYTVVENSKDMIEWTESYGVTWTVDTGLYYGQTAHRMHTADGAGAGLTTALIDAMEADENITVMMDCKIQGLLLDDSGAVAGAYGVNADGADVTLVAANTVLATSGFGNNDEMIAKYCPEASAAYRMVAPGATGEGIMWGAELGASLEKMGAYQGYAWHDADDDTVLGQDLANNGGIAINAEGNRFMNEYGGYSELTPHILAQTDHICYLCFTDEQASKSAKFEAFKEAGIVYEGADEAELAAAIGVNADKLAWAFEDYRKGIERGEDRFNRTHLPAGFEGPFYALKVTGEIRHTQGGMKTDVAGHVLKQDGSLIDGLYAAGGCTEGFSSGAGAAYMSGNGLIQALVYGKLAGIGAATEKRGEAQLVTWEKTEKDAYI